MLEQRYLKSNCELRTGPNGEPMIVGLGAVFDSDSEDLGGFIEQIDPGAFTKTLQEADVRGLGNHDVNWLLGRTKPGTLRLSAGPAGLAYEIDVNMADPDGVRAKAKVDRRDWDGSSFTFQCVRDQWDWNASPPRRRVLEAKLVDVGPVTFPAYPDTTAASRALDRLAQKLGKPADQLALALRSGEIRSLVDVDPATPPVDTEKPEPRTLPANAELRAGKTISAATASSIRDAMGSLQALLDASDETTGGGLTNEANSLKRALAPAMRGFARLLEEREMPDLGGDPENLVSMAGAVAGAYMAKLAELGLDAPEYGFSIGPWADQDGDQDGDGPTLWYVSDNAATWYVLADGDTADVIAWDGNEWSSAWRSTSAETESRMAFAEATVRTRERDLLAIAK